MQLWVIGGGGGKVISGQPACNGLGQGSRLRRSTSPRLARCDARTAVGPQAATREFLNKFARGMTNKRYDVCALLEQGDTVMVEGVESYDKKGKRVSLPYRPAKLFRDAA